MKKNDVTRLHVVIMGVSGSGKSTVGSALAKRLAIPFIDADDLHPTINRQKMESGHPLTDEDRWPWLDRVGIELSNQINGAVVACSALKKSYRTRILSHCPDATFILLTGNPELLLNRMQLRKDHFMPPALLESQLETLEPFSPKEPGTEFDASLPLAQLVSSIQDRLLSCRD